MESMANIRGLGWRSAHGTDPLLQISKTLSANTQDQFPGAGDNDSKSENLQPLSALKAPFANKG